MPWSILVFVQWASCKYHNEYWCGLTSYDMLFLLRRSLSYVTRYTSILATVHQLVLGSSISGLTLCSHVSVKGVQAANVVFIEAVFSFDSFARAEAYLLPFPITGGSVTCVTCVTFVTCMTCVTWRRGDVEPELMMIDLYALCKRQLMHSIYIPRPCV